MREECTLKCRLPSPVIALMGRFPSADWIADFHFGSADAPSDVIALEVPNVGRDSDPELLGDAGTEGAIRYELAARLPFLKGESPIPQALMCRVTNAREAFPKATEDQIVIQTVPTWPAPVSRDPSQWGAARGASPGQVGYHLTEVEGGNLWG